MMRVSAGVPLGVDFGQQFALDLFAKHFDIFKDQRSAPRLFYRGQKAIIRVNGLQTDAASRHPLHMRNSLGSRIFASPIANRVQRMGHQCFPRTRFPINQDVAIGLCDIQNIFAQPLHRVDLPISFFINCVPSDNSGATHDCPR